MKHTFIAALLLAGMLPLVVSAHAGDSPGSFIELSPRQATYEQGHTFPVEVAVHSADSVTSFQIELAYDESTVEVVSIETNNQDFPFWWEQEAENGTVKLAASVPAPGFQGEATVATLQVKGKKAGSASFAVSPASMLLNEQDESVLAGQEFAEANIVISGGVSGPAGAASPTGAVSPGLVFLIVALLVGAAIAFVVGRSIMRKKSS